MNAIERRIRRIDAFQQRHRVAAVAVGVVKKFGDDNGGALCAQLTYTMFLTIFPLLLLLITVLSIVFANDPSARHRVLSTAFGQFPIVGTQLANNLHAMKRSSVFGIVVGLLGLAYGSTGLAQTGLYAMSQVWNIPNSDRPNFWGRMARSVVFLAVLAIGLIVTTTLAGFATFGQHRLIFGILGELLAGLTNVGLYVAAFRVLTPKQIKTRELLPGALLAAVAWTALQSAGGYVVGHDLKGASAVYGLFGLVLGLMAWLYLGAEVTLYSAELNVVRHQHLWPRALVQPPLTEADQRSLAQQATQNRRRPEQAVTTSFRGRPMMQDEFRARGYQADTDSKGLTTSEPSEETDTPNVG